LAFISKEATLYAFCGIEVASLRMLQGPYICGGSNSVFANWHKGAFGQEIASELKARRGNFFK
jgi:hypothetical protein